MDLVQSASAMAVLHNRKCVAIIVGIKGGTQKGKMRLGNQKDKTRLF